MKGAMLLLLLLLGLAEAQEEAKPEILILANEIDYKLAQDFFSFLDNQSIGVTRVTAEEFEAKREERFILILGGPDAYEGVGEIVREVLDDEEEEYLREEGNRRMYVKTNVWRGGQIVYIIAGSERNETREAHEENRGKLNKSVKKAMKNEVKIQGYAFIPRTMVIEKGDIITWINMDNVAHTTTRTRSFDSGRLDRGDSWSNVFNAIGIKEYRCTYHPYMKGTIIIQPEKTE